MTYHVDVIVTSHFTDSVIGSCTRKQRLRLDTATAERLEGLGLVKPANPSVRLAESPLTAPLDAGGGKSHVSLPAGQASQPMIAPLPWPKDGEPLSSMTATDSHQLPTPSTPAMEHGGMSTIKPSEIQGSPESAGRKKRGRPAGSKSTTSAAKMGADSGAVE